MTMQRIGSLPKRGYLDPLPLFFYQEQLQEVDMQLENFVGKKYHWLTIIGVTEYDKVKQCRFLIAKCKCGNIIKTNTTKLNKPKHPSCGCWEGSFDRYKVGFEEKIEKSPNCWIWTGCVDNNGYGVYGRREKGKQRITHRVAYELYKGKIPDGMVVRHLCHNKLCVNPDHLELGTYQDNMDDMVKADRQAKGQNQGAAKLTDSDVRKIRQLYKEGMPSRPIAKMFNMDKSTILDIVNRKYWKHVLD